MKRHWHIPFWLALFLITLSSRAAEPLRQHYLFVVDTSRNMAPLAASARNAVYDLLDSGIQNQIHPGDTFEVWTFDMDVRTNSFPQSMWVADNHNAYAVQAADFLRKHSHNRVANFTKTAEAISTAIRVRPVITVFLITDGRTALTNLPFATPINAIYREHSDDLRGELRPFITTLVADSGQWVAWSVGSGGRQLEIPRVTLPPPKPEKPPIVLAQTPASAPKKITVEETKPTPTPQPAPVVTTPTPAPTPAVTEPKPVTPAPIEPARPVTPAVVETKPEIAPAPVVTPTASPTPAPLTVTPPREETKPVVEAKSVAKPEPAPPVTFAPAPVETAKPDAAKPPPPAAKTEPTPPSTPAPAPQVVETPRPEPKPTPPTTATTAVITPKSASNNSYLLVAVGLIGLAAVLLFLYLRPKPRTKGASLITRSLDRPEK